MSEAQDGKVIVRPKPFVITVQLAQPWQVVTPAVYRYENAQWIDEFFDTGRLRLSSFAQFAKYPDEARGDPNEGSAFCYGEAPNDRCVIVQQTQGMTSAVFCCSHRLDRDLQNAFQRNSVFEIINTVAFAHEISRQIPGFRQGYEGSCIYRSDGRISRKVDIDWENYKLPDGNIDMRLMTDSMQALGGAELILLKRKQYENQQEYRLLWELDMLPGDFIDVAAPMARQYCRRVQASDY